MILEFLGLKDEYSESALEEALVLRLEQFLLEFGNDFAFIARQRRLRGKRMASDRSIVFPSSAALPCNHRPEDRQVFPCGRLPNESLPKLWSRALDSGQREPTYRLILSSEKNEAVAHYALGTSQTKCWPANTN